MVCKKICEYIEASSVAYSLGRTNRDEHSCLKIKCADQAESYYEVAQKNSNIRLYYIWREVKKAFNIPSDVDSDILSETELYQEVKDCNVSTEDV